MSKLDAAALSRLAVQAIEDLKGHDIVAIDVRALTDVMDRIVIATGTSSRHVKSIAGNVREELCKAGERPIGVEGLHHQLYHQFQNLIKGVTGTEHAADIREDRQSTDVLRR